MPMQRFEALIFDWEGTAVPDREADTSTTRQRIESLCAAGVHVFVVSDADESTIDRQLGARPAGPGRLHHCVNGGSEVFEVTTEGPAVVWRRVATKADDEALDRAAATVVALLASRGIDTRVLSERVNRRTIDLTPDLRSVGPPNARLGEVVKLVGQVARAPGLSELRITTDGRRIEIGLTDKSDSARWAAGWLGERGITGALVLLGGDEFGPVGAVAGRDTVMVVPELARAVVVSVGVEPEGTPDGVLHLPGGPSRFGELLECQLRRRREALVPPIDPDPGWVMTLLPDRSVERVTEALGALCNGWAGTRGTWEEDWAGASPLLLVNGVYTDGETSRLLSGPRWTALDIRNRRRSHRHVRLLDLRSGILVRSGGERDLKSVRFVSAAHPHLFALRAEAPQRALVGTAPLAPPADAVHFDRDKADPDHLARVGNGQSSVAVGVRDRQVTTHGRTVVERLGAWEASRGGDARWDDVVEHLGRAEALGFDRLLSDHREAWARRWADAEVVIDGDPDDQLAARFAVFHLLSCAPEDGEAAVGPRGLTGDAYGGHVFWDADVYVLPALAAIRPAAARAMLEYRIRRLPAAKAAAAALGHRGARFPWESAADGTDVTPEQIRDRRGQPIAVHSGQREEHIVADVAWAADHYATWTGDTAFLDGPGRDLVVETARYWASRVHRGSDGAGHIDDVMGPDEYHERVDDNAYTNVMARWNLRRGADLLDAAGRPMGEASAWRELSDALVDGWDAGRGLYEQFAGYWGHEPMLIHDVAAPPVAADVLLGRNRVTGSQIIKQADVLMLHHLVPGEVVPGSLPANLAFYDDRCAHGSSLSPAIHASLFARAGQPDRALQLFRLAARLDLDDLTGTTAGGIHLATMGGLWQALAQGFLGLHANGDTLEIDPCLPWAWNAVGLRFRFHGQPIGVHADHEATTVTCATSLNIRVNHGRLLRGEPPGITVAADRSVQ